MQIWSYLFVLSQSTNIFPQLYIQSLLSIWPSVSYIVGEILGPVDRSPSSHSPQGILQNIASIEVVDGKLLCVEVGSIVAFKQGIPGLCQQLSLPLESVLLIRCRTEWSWRFHLWPDIANQELCSDPAPKTNKTPSNTSSYPWARQVSCGLIVSLLFWCD